MDTPGSAPYQVLLARMREVALLNSTTALLHWDQQTYMPPRATDFRAGQVAYFSGQSHRIFTAPQVGDWLRACEDAGLTQSTDAAVSTNVRGWRRHYDRATRISAELVEEYESAKVRANAAWEQAREHNDFPSFAPHLERVFTLTARMADLWGYEASRYDALLEGFEPGAREADLRPLFDMLGASSAALLGPAAERSARVPADLLAGEYPVAAQQAFNREVAAALGFDFEAGSIDTTAHPFCSGVAPGDCRLTTRYDERNFLVSLYGVMHEAGHGLYEQGLPASAHGLPAGTAASLGIHESQSRLWENQVGRAPEFWAVWLPRAAHHFPHLARRTPEEMFAAVNRVRPSFIRVEADQVTYDLHIILRFGLERRIMAGELAVADIPAAWNEAFETLLGVPVPDDARGCLQDVHWSDGLVGYFPTYTLGNVYGAQLYRRALADRPGVRGELAAGRYGGLLGWMREKVHRHGEAMTAGELVAQATGEPPRAEYYLEGMREKFR